MSHPPRTSARMAVVCHRARPPARGRAAARVAGLADVGRHGPAQHGVVDNGAAAAGRSQTRENIKWKAELGSTSYGNPVVADGKVFVGTNNANPRNPDLTGDLGVLMCFRESDGKFLWQATSDKLESRQDNDWPEQGICSSPAVEGKRLYYVTSRGELVCLDTEGMLDGKNDGPVKDEAHTGPTDGDVIWRLDMMKELVCSSTTWPTRRLSSGATWSSCRRRTVATRATRTSPRRARRAFLPSTSTPVRSSGRTIRPETASCTVSGPRRRSATSTASCRSSSPAATAGSTASTPAPARSSGSST